MTVFDIAIIGGGVNGCGIARDAAGRGLSVFLAEQDDLASGTSSASTKLIHGGLRYLEHFEFSLVRESLREREVLWRLAPHIVHPLRFVLPHREGLRPRWLIRLGLFLYDHLGGRKHLPASRSLNLTTDPAGAPLRGGFAAGFEYSDCWVDDARLVVLNARDAADRGAVIRTRTEVTAAVRDDETWRLDCLCRRSGATETIRARCLVNTTGPWIGEVIENRLGSASKNRVRLVKGSHFVVPRLYDHDKAYIFQNADQRVIFAIPYEEDFTLIGTTDRDYEGRPEDVAMDGDETDYLCATISDYFRTPVTAADIVWSYSGIRPLHDDGSPAAQQATRDYTLELDDNGPVAIHVFGGKITTYRLLAEEVLQKLSPWLPGMGPAWTAGPALPGGDFPLDGCDALCAQLAAHYPQLPPDLLQRFARSYGSNAAELLGDAQTVASLGRSFGTGLYQREVEYLMKHEWARSAADIVWRRSKRGLRMSEAEIAGLDDWIAAQAAIDSGTAGTKTG